MQDDMERMLEEQLAMVRARKAAAAKPAVTLPTPAAPLTPTPSYQKLISDEVARQMNEFKASLAVPAAVVPANQGMTQDMLMKAAEELFKASLPAADLIWLHEHVQAGAPGFGDFLLSDDIKSVVQLGFENYKEFLAKRAK